ncbi:YnaM/YnfT family protein [Enterobacter pasteurii]
MTTLILSTIVAIVLALIIFSLVKIGIGTSNNPDEL